MLVTLPSEEAIEDGGAMPPQMPLCRCTHPVGDLIGKGQEAGRDRVWKDKTAGMKLCFVLFAFTLFLIALEAEVQ
eukprot:6459482-Amphidinium_carterae.2